jgi:lipoate-protein ligase A
MDYYFLDAVSWEHSQALYHAAAHLGREALFVLRPSTPYVCIGYHQDAVAEIDLDFAHANNIPVFRREVGGGAVYLDGKQLFFQLIVDKNRKEVPSTVAGFYEKFLQPVIDTFHDFGVPAAYKPVNDIIANGRKISGTGAAQINDMWVLVGNFIQDFNFEMMSKVLRVPDEKFRDKVYKTMSENLTTFLRETGSIPENRDLGDALAQKYEAILGKMNYRLPDPDLFQKADELIKEMHTPEWLMSNDRRGSSAKQVKISEGVFVIQKVLKTPGGLIRVTAINRDGYLHDVHISGDFFIFPPNCLNSLEEVLEGVEANEATLEAAVAGFYSRQSIESPGVVPHDFAQLLISQ